MAQPYSQTVITVSDEVLGEEGREDIGQVVEWYENKLHEIIHQTSQLLFTEKQKAEIRKLAREITSEALALKNRSHSSFLSQL